MLALPELQHLSSQDYIDGSQSVRGEHHLGPLSDDEMGKSVAIDMVRSLPSNAKEGASISFAISLTQLTPRRHASFSPALGRLEIRQLGSLCEDVRKPQLLRRRRFAYRFGLPTRSGVLADVLLTGDAGRQGLIAELQQLAEEIRSHKLHSKLADLRPLFYRCAAHLVNAKEVRRTEVPLRL